MTSKRIQDIVWEELYAAEVRARYFAKLAGRLKSRERWMALALAVLSLGTVGTIVAKQPDAALLLSLTTLVLSAVLATFKFDKGKALGATLGRQWTEIAAEYEILWAQLAELEEEEVLTRHRDLLTKHFPSDELAIAEFPQNDRLLSECWKAVAASRGLEVTA